MDHRTTSKKETVWQKFATKLSCHGFPDLGSAERNTERAAWGLLVSLFLFLLGHGVVQTTMEFVQSPVVTSIAHVGTTMIPFPKVYICPPELVDYSTLDPYTLEKVYNATHCQAKEENATAVHLEPQRNYGTVAAAVMRQPTSTPKSLLERTLSVWQKADGSFYAAAGSNKPPVRNGMIRNKYDNESIQELFLRAGVPMAEFFEECAFQASMFPCDNRTEPIFDMDMGTCFLMDVGEAQAKRGSGLEMVLSMPYKYYNWRMKDLEPLATGASMWIGDEFDPFSKSRLLIPANHQVRISIRKKVTTLIDAPRSRNPQRCIAEGLTLATFNVTYTVDACQADCLQREVTRECRCLRPTDSRYLNEKVSKIPICLAEDVVLCVSPLVEKYAKTATQARRKNTGAQSEATNFETPEEQRDYYSCISKCERPCKYTSHDMTVTQSELRMFGGKVVLEIAFDSLDVVYIQQHPGMTATGYISNLGGQLGIWLGASLLTLVQVIVFAISHCSTTTKRNDEQLKETKEKNYNDPIRSASPAKNGPRKIAYC